MNEKQLMRHFYKTAGLIVTKKDEHGELVDYEVKDGEFINL